MTEPPKYSVKTLLEFIFHGCPRYVAIGVTDGVFVGVLVGVGDILPPGPGPGGGPPPGAGGKYNADRTGCGFLISFILYPFRLNQFFCLLQRYILLQN